MKATLYTRESELPTPTSGLLKPGIREKAAAKGISGLSDDELIGLMLGSGIKGRPVGVLSRELLPILAENAHRGMEPEHLMQTQGIGAAKAGMLCGAMEFYRRIFNPRGKKISSPRDVLPLIHHFADRDQEHFITVYLNGAHEVIQIRVTSIGLINRTIVHPREVYSPAVELRCVAIIVAHNHPSGNLEPSREDMEVTERLLRAGEILGIPLLDHIILGNTGSSSLLELGLFPG